MREAASLTWGTSEFVIASRVMVNTDPVMLTLARMAPPARTGAAMHRMPR